MTVTANVAVVVVIMGAVTIYASVKDVVQTGNLDMSTGYR